MAAKNAAAGFAVGRWTTPVPLVEGASLAADGADGLVPGLVEATIGRARMPFQHGHVANAAGWRERPGLVDLATLQPIADDPQRQEVFALLAQDDPQTIDVEVVELAIARRCALGVDEALALEEADLGDGDVGELLEQERQDLTDGQVRVFRHGLPVGLLEEHETELADLQLVALHQRRLVDAGVVDVGAVQRADIAHHVRLTGANDLRMAP